MIGQEPPQHPRAERHDHVVDFDREAVLDRLDLLKVELGEGDVAGSVRNALKDTDTEEPGAPTGCDAHLRTEPEIEVEREVEIEVRAGEDCPATISDAPVTDTRAGAADAVVPV